MLRFLLIELWMSGMVLLFLMKISELIFKNKFKKFGEFIGAIPLIITWPLTLFSPKGRTILFSALKKL